jgi:hypothetical protein
MSALRARRPPGHLKHLSRVIVAAFALYAILVHAIALDAGRLSYLANASHLLALTDICQPTASGDQQNPATPISHTDCAWMCAAGACGASGPAAAYLLTPLLAFIQRVLPKAWEKPHLPWRNSAILGARAPPVV